MVGESRYIQLAKAYVAVAWPGKRINLVFHQITDGADARTIAEVADSDDNTLALSCGVEMDRACDWLVGQLVSKDFLLDTLEVAGILGVSRSTVRRLALRGKLKPVEYGTSPLGHRFAPADVKVHLVRQLATMHHLSREYHFGSQ